MPTPNKQPKGPKLIDPSLYKQAGIDQKTGLPSRMVDSVEMLRLLLIFQIKLNLIMKN